MYDIQHAPFGNLESAIVRIYAIFPVSQGYTVAVIEIV